MERWTREFGLDGDSPKPTAEEQLQLEETTKALNDCRSAASRRIQADRSPGSATPASP
jgi:hypothetical protein